MTSTLDKLFPILWLLAFLSLIGAIVCATLFHRRHRRVRPARYVPVAVYVILLAISGVIGLVLGFNWGISLACSSPKAPNLCGLWGAFVTGPFAASLGIFLAGALVAVLPSDQNP